MSTQTVLEQINYEPTSSEVIKVRLMAKGLHYPNLQNILDGLAMSGKVKTKLVENKVCYERLQQVFNLAKNADRKLADLAKNPLPKPFRLTSFDPPQPKKIARYDLGKEILAVLNHDGPSTLEILNRLRKSLHLNDFELSFYDVKIKLREMEAEGLVGVLKPTETTAGGWTQPRKPRVKL